MPTIPLYPVGGTAAPAPLPGPRMSGGTPADFGAIGAQQGMEVGAKVQDFANEQMALQNQVRVNDALNQARQKALDLTYDPQYGYLSQTGRTALQRDSGQALPDEYGGRFDEALSQIGTDLTPQQRRVFQMQAANMATSFREGVSSHMLRESKAYALSVQDSTLKLAGDSAAQVWNDPRQINGGVDDQGNEIPGIVQQAKAAVYASSKITGMDPQAAMLEAGSHIHSKVIEMALENNNPIYATNYLQQHSKDMTPDDILRVQGRVNSAAEASIAVLATDAARKRFETAAAPTDMGRLWNLVTGQESRGQDFNADGTPMQGPLLKSGERAMYASQVLPSTARDPGYGIKPADESGTPQQVAAEYNRVGQQKLTYLLQHFGSVPQALAAYNAGEAVVEKAVKDAGPGWLQTMPKETQDYVAAITGKFGAGGGAAQLPTEQQFIDAAESQIGPNPRPNVLQLTRQRAAQQYQLMVQGRKQAGDDAEKAVQQALIQNGGDVAALQREQPNLLANLAAVDPGRYDNVITFAKTLTKGERTDNMEAYALAWAHPEEMAKMSEPVFTSFVHSNFTDATGKELVKRLEDYRDGKVDAGVGAINDSALKQTLDERLTNAGMKVGPKASSTEKASYGTVAKFLRDGIFEAQRDLGRKLTPEEVGQFVDTQFQRGEPQKRWFGLAADRFRPDLTMTYGDVPSEVRSQIDAKMPGATEGDKLRVYWTWKQRPPKKTADAAGFAALGG